MCARITYVWICAWITAGFLWREFGGTTQRSPLDLTNDLYHRTKAGLFRPDREPVVLQMARSNRAIGRAVPVPGEYLSMRWDEGSLAVKGDAVGQVVVYMNAVAFYGHFQIESPSSCDGAIRHFSVWPTHPVIGP